MTSRPILAATLQAALLGATSNVLAQLIAAGRDKVRRDSPLNLPMPWPEAIRQDAAQCSRSTC